MDKLLIRKVAAVWAFDEIMRQCGNAQMLRN